MRSTLKDPSSLYSFARVKVEICPDVMFRIDEPFVEVGVWLCRARNVVVEDSLARLKIERIFGSLGSFDSSPR